MLYILDKGNHPDIEYDEGQEPIVHLKADLGNIVQWANQNGIHWAFTDRNAGTYLVSFFSNLRDLDQINWDAVSATNWQDSVIKEGKQAELLIHNTIPWHLVTELGVVNQEKKQLVESIIANAAHKPVVNIKQNWYY